MPERCAVCGESSELDDILARSHERRTGHAFVPALAPNWRGQDTGEGALKSIPVLRDREAFRAFKKEYGLRDDWHEPDEQGIDAKVIGASFDNAGFPEIEMQVLFIKRENGGESWVARVNLANLCAWAAH